MEGEGTRELVKGSWPTHLAHHTYKSREDWEPVIRQKVDTCKISFCYNHVTSSIERNLKVANLR